MNISKESLDEINRVYYELEMNCIRIFRALFHRIFEIEFGWYNGYYRKEDDGNRSSNFYPIPVISVRGICDIEIQFDEIIIETKLRRAAALAYSYEKLKAFSFEARGAEDPMSDYYHEGQTIQDLKKSITEGDETEILFSFSFPFNADEKEIFEFVKLLRREHFYY